MEKTVEGKWRSVLLFKQMQESSFFSTNTTFSQAMAKGSSK